MFFYFVQDKKIFFVLFIVVLLVWSDDHDPTGVTVDPAGVFFLVESDVFFFTVPPMFFREVVFNSQLLKDFFGEVFVQRCVQVKFNIIQRAEGFEEALDFGAFMHESVISTVAKEVFEFLDGSVLVGLNFEWDEIFEFSVGTLDEEVLNFDGNDDFFIVKRNRAHFARSLHSLHEVEMTAFAP